VRVRCLEPVDQLVQGGLDLVGVASHQDSVLQRVSAEGFDFLDVLVQHFDLFEARHRLAVRLPPHRRRLGSSRAHHFDPELVPPNMNLAINSDNGMAPWVIWISPPGGSILVSPPGSSTTTMPPSSDSLTILAWVSVGRLTFADTIMRTTAWWLWRSRSTPVTVPAWPPRSVPSAPRFSPSMRSKRAMISKPAGPLRSDLA